MQSGWGGGPRERRAVKPCRRRLAVADRPKSAFLRAGAGQPAMVGRRHKLVAGQGRAYEAATHRLQHAGVNSAPYAGCSKG